MAGSKNHIGDPLYNAMVIPRKRSIITLVYKSMKLNLMELAYTEHLTAGTNDINSNNNCYTAKSETQFTG